MDGNEWQGVPEESPAPDNFDDVDVPAALERTTDDGPGFAGDLSNIEQHLPPSDFEENQ